ncbi:hypothetical protein COX85_02325 [Candidatus Micrarchaeota archaeon CG_4_10_14_0_2_um_filter_55_9]|nr:MAG: hypothetical protein COT57_02540 [Candidatus Micrarchaeota archaeon CG09_land_8_20_14_0_10_55_25]PIZ91726.1 MAG: hypothetical protein COX85_02325 [Candidatus Micrarchaeota archaeon CG_4_10_14_0_2_um_filter_55_9]PJD01267.1 MAG: hypothetical protein COU38_01960 [Candidatus Micrarchaeota archaeon CG10_big_fil_rev_8_21_14_0_10_54_18]
MVKKTKLDAKMGKNFDAVYQQYDFKRSPFGYSREYYEWYRKPMFTEAARWLEPGSVLDDGGGFGYFSEFVPKHDYYLLDISKEMLGYYKGKRKFLGRGEKLPFDGCFFDNVVSLGVLRQVEDEDAYLEEAWRVLKPGGVFVISTPRKEWIRHLLRSWLFWTVLYTYMKYSIPAKIAGFLGLQAKQLTPDKYFSEVEIKNKLGALGFIIIHQTRFSKALPGITSQWFCEKFVNEKKYGQFLFFVCRKPLKNETGGAKNRVEKRDC